MMSKKEKKLKQFNNPKFYKYILHQITSSWIIWLLLVLSVFTPFIINHYGLSEKPIGIVLSNISFGYIAGMIFYVFSDLIPNTKKAIKEYNLLLYLVDCRLRFEMESLLNSNLYEHRKDKSCFKKALTASLCNEDISSASRLTSVTISKETYSKFMFDLDKAVLSSNIIINAFRGCLSPQWSMILYKITNLEELLNKLITDNGTCFDSVLCNIEAFASEYSSLKFGLDKMILEIEDYKFYK